jgi:4-hydroxybenzoate polyprenyltransferase
MLANRLVTSADKYIDKIENVKIPTPLFALHIFFLISLRDIFEQIFFEEQFSIFQFMHHFFFYILMFQAGVIIISSIAKRDIEKVARIVSSGFFLILLPPLIDHFIFHRSFPYEYILPNEFIRQFLRFFLFTSKAGHGIAIEIAALLFLASLYVGIKSRSLLRAVLTGIVLYILTSISVAPRLFLPIPDTQKYIFYHSRHIIYFGFYFILNMVIGLIYLARVNKHLPGALIKEMISFRTLHFILIVLVGAHFNDFLHFFVFPDFIYILTCVALIIMIWMFTLLTNNVYDLEIDKVSNPHRPLVEGQVCPAHYLGIASVLALIAIFMSPVLGSIPFVITLISILSSLAYSVPPIRLRRKLLSTVFIGWGSFLAFFIGIFATVRIKGISVDTKVIHVALLIFLAFSIGPLTKDLKDYEGDLKNGVRTLFTTYGIQKATKMASLFLGLSLVLPLSLFHTRQDFIVLGSLSILTVGSFYLRKSVSVSYIGYGLVFSYCGLRALGYL